MHRADRIRLTLLTDEAVLDDAQSAACCFFQKQQACYKLHIIDELGFVPLPKTGAELDLPSITLFLRCSE